MSPWLDIELLRGWRQAVRKLSLVHLYPGVHLESPHSVEEVEPLSHCFSGDVGVMSPGQVLTEFSSLKPETAESLHPHPYDDMLFIPLIPLTCKVLLSSFLATSQPFCSY